MYVQDYGAPIGWRLALRAPSAITAIISQSGNGYDAGFVESFWKVVRAYQSEPTAETEAPVRQFLTLDATRWQYLTGVADETLVDPESWHHDYALLSRPGNDLVQLKLFRDYATNAPMYPQVHEYFRATRVPLLAVWGRGDEIFGPAGAEAFADDLPDARDSSARRRAFPAGVRTRRSHRADPQLPCRPRARLTAARGRRSQQWAGYPINGGARGLA